MPRIKLFNSREGLSSEQSAVYDAIVSGPRGKIQGPLMAALHNPDLADKWQKLGASLRYGTSLPLRLSELVILVTARAWSCQLEWHLHEQYARAAGLEQAIIDAVKAGDMSGVDDQAVIEAHDFCEELLRARRVSEPVYQRALARFGEVGVVEMTALSGYYTMVALTLNAHEFPLPEGVPAPFAEPAP
jgi:4-carboxymuconolactone decarboxylase